MVRFLFCILSRYPQFRDDRQRSDDVRRVLDDRTFKLDSLSSQTVDLIERMICHVDIPTDTDNAAKNLLALCSGADPSNEMMEPVCISKNVWKCPECAREFKSKSATQVHIYTHKKEIKFECDMCGRAFSDRSNLKAHMMSHHDGKRFACSYDDCTKRFKSKAGLKYHVRLVHTKEFPYSCDVPGCAKVFANRSNWRRHVKSHRRRLERQAMRLQQQRNERTKRKRNRSQ